MVTYNLAAEYAAPFIILIIVVSFLTDYEEKNLVNRFMKVLYWLTLVASVALIVSIHTGIPRNGYANVTHIYITNTLYLLTVPLPSCLYLLLCTMISSRNDHRVTLRKSFIYCIAPYCIYALVVVSNIGNGLISSASETEGYIRGQWYQLPFIIVGIHILMIVHIMWKHRKYIHKEVLVIVMVNMILAGSLAVIQFVYSHIILTSIGNVASILAMHLYIQSERTYISKLTGSKNRLAMQEQMEEYANKGILYSIYVISFRDFKQINASYGREFGNQVLQKITKEIMLFFPYTAVYRYSGDEFAILLKEEHCNDATVQACIHHLQTPISVGVSNPTVQLDFVCAKVDNQQFGSSNQELIAAIEYSLSLLKETRGEPKYLYNKDVITTMQQRRKRINLIKEAIEQRNIFVYYQPIYSVKQGQFTQVEALVRLQDEDGTVMLPDQFIGLAEDAGLIVPMTYCILDIVCEDMQLLRLEYGDELTIDSVSVNLPPHIFASANRNEIMMEILSRYNIPMDFMKIEITERAFMDNREVVMNMMCVMQQIGFVFALDDFGVDYSNMSTLLNLPMDLIKIDEHVIATALKNKENRIFFQHLVDGIKATGRTIIAEGVEDEEQLLFVIKSGCEYVQGFILSKPLERKELLQFLRPYIQKALLDIIPHLRK